MMRCEPYVHESTKTKETNLYTPFYMLSEALEVLRQWGTEAMLEAYDETSVFITLACEFAESLGIDLFKD